MKKTLLFLLIMLVFPFFFASDVFSQSPPTQAAQSWKCMRGEEKGFTFNGASNATFTQELYADGYPADIDAYIVVCVGSEAGSICTTGDPNYDKIIFNNDNTSLFPYQVSIEGGSKHKIALGKLRVNATVTTQGLTGGMVFYSVTFADVEATVGTGPGQKLGVFPFADSFTTKCVSITWNTVFPPPPPPPPARGEEDECFRRNARGCMTREEFWAHERWDPFGIVFDSQSLEPLPNVKVTILDRNKNKYNLVGLMNPQITKADGLFNFLVEPGRYYLLVEPLPGYNFKADPNLYPNYANIYHKIDGSNSIYKPNEEIIEEIDTPGEAFRGRPDMEHRDIPLDPGSNLPYSGTPSTISYNMKRIGNSINVDGKVSHPFTEVSFYQGEELLDLLTKTRADRFGYFEAFLSSAVLKPDQNVYVVYAKADLRTYDSITISLLNSFRNFISSLLSKFSNIAVAQTKIAQKLTLAPIPAYIEGYGYDYNNELISDATVRLKLNMNKATFYETKTDKNGYFVIPPKHSPIFPYYLEIVKNDGETLVYSTSAIASKNKEFLDENKIDLLGGTREGKTVSKDAADFSPPSAPLEGSKIVSTQGAQKKPDGIFYIFIILFSLILSGFAVFFIYKKKKFPFISR